MLTELRATAAYAFWYPFSDALEYIPGYDDDGIGGALITTTTAIGLTITIGLAANSLDSAIQPPLPTSPPPVLVDSGRQTDASHVGALPTGPPGAGYGVRMYGANINTLHAGATTNSGSSVIGGVAGGSDAGGHGGDVFATASHLGDGLSMMHLDPGR